MFALIICCTSVRTKGNQQSLVLLLRKAQVVDSYNISKSQLIVQCYVGILNIKCIISITSYYIAPPAYDVVISRALHSNLTAIFPGKLSSLRS